MPSRLPFQWTKRGKVPDDFLLTGAPQHISAYFTLFPLSVKHPESASCFNNVSFSVRQSLKFLSKQRWCCPLLIFRRAEVIIPACLGALCFGIGTINQGKAVLRVYVFSVTQMLPVLLDLVP